MNDNAGLEKEADVMGGKIFSNTELTQTEKMAGNDSVYQRMVIVGSAAEDVDSVIAADISFQHHKAEGMIIMLDSLLKEDPKKYKINDGEGIILTTHGSPGMVGDYTSTEIIEGLTKIGNLEKAKYIYIASCDSATEEGDSLLSVIDVISGVFPHIPVYGAPGVAINDYSGITGDNQTRYIKENEDLACEIEDYITNIYYPEVKTALGINSLDQIKEFGDHLLEGSRFMSFYDLLIKALSGKLSDQEIADIETKGGNEDMTAFFNEHTPVVSTIDKGLFPLIKKHGDDSLPSDYGSM